MCVQRLANSIRVEDEAANEFSPPEDSEKLHRKAPQNTKFISSFFAVNGLRHIFDEGLLSDTAVPLGRTRHHYRYRVFTFDAAAAVLLVPMHRITYCAVHWKCG